MAGELKLNNVSVATESGGTVTIAPNNITFAANHAGIKTALNAGGNAPVYACRAWINFSGEGTISIRGSGNVSSLTDNGTGNYQVNFSTAMEDTNYSAVLGQSVHTHTSSSKTVVYGSEAALHYATTHIQIKSGQISQGSVGNAIDLPSLAAAIFR